MVTVTSRLSETKAERAFERDQIQVEVSEVAREPSRQSSRVMPLTAPRLPQLENQAKHDSPASARAQDLFPALAPSPTPSRPFLRRTTSRRSSEFFTTRRFYKVAVAARRKPARFALSTWRSWISELKKVRSRDTTRASKAAPAEDPVRLRHSPKHHCGQLHLSASIT